jgi:CheY-like chemotaxis protein
VTDHSTSDTAGEDNSQKSVSPAVYTDLQALLASIEASIGPLKSNDQLAPDFQSEVDLVLASLGRMRVMLAVDKPYSASVSRDAPNHDLANGKRPGKTIFAKHGTETILVAEDDPGARRIISRILQGHGYKVVEAENGASALRAVQHDEGNIDLLLADVMMPDFDGPALAEQASKLKPGLKVIYASGFNKADLDRQDVFLQGEEVYLVKKPFRREELLSLVRQVLDA